MIDFTRRRFLTISGLSVAGVILPRGVQGAEGALIQAVEDRAAVALRLAKAVLESVAPAPRGPAYPMAARQETTRRVDALIGHLVDEFDEMPSVAETWHAMYGHRMREFSLGEARAHAERVLPVAIPKVLFTKYSVPFDLCSAQRFDEFAIRYRDVIFKSGDYQPGAEA